MTAEDRSSALSVFLRATPQLVVIGTAGSDPWEGVELADQLRRRDAALPLIMVSEQSSERLAIAALRAGVSDYFRLPLGGGELLASVRRLLAKLPETAAGVPAAPGPVGPRMVAESPVMRELRCYLLKAAATESTVLVTGETGTGKELVAETVHEASSRCRGPLMSINSAALPEALLESELFGHERGAFTGAVDRRVGKLEQAAGGTVFLDEIGDMSLHCQAKILRAIEKREIFRLGGTQAIPLDVRWICATHRDLEQMVAEGTFRSDLYYRLNVARVHLPPLRERKEDIPPLVALQVRNLNRRTGRRVEGLTSEASEALSCYDWPGNVRELRNVLESAYINGPGRLLSIADLPASFRRRFEEEERPEQAEKERLLAALEETKWNKSRAAERLSWSRMTLYRKLEKYRIVAPDVPVGS